MSTYVRVVRQTTNRLFFGYMLIRNDGAIFQIGDGMQNHGDGTNTAGATGYTDYVGGDFTPDGSSYRLIRSNGDVYAFGPQANTLNAGSPLANPIVGLFTDPSTSSGYWFLDNTGGVATYGTANFWGALTTTNVATMCVRPDGQGYYIIDQTGSYWGYGTGTSTGSFTVTAPGHIQPGGECSPSGNGFTVCDDIGGVYCVGDATFENSPFGVGQTPLPDFIGSICCSGSGGGYWLSGKSKGGIWTFGDAKFRGGLS